VHMAGFWIPQMVVEAVTVEHRELVLGGFA
jgi:hypothetical protein